MSVSFDNYERAERWIDCAVGDLVDEMRSNYHYSDVLLACVALELLLDLLLQKSRAAIESSLMQNEVYPLLYGAISNDQFYSTVRIARNMIRDRRIESCV